MPAKKKPEESREDGHYGLGSQEPGGISYGYDMEPGINLGSGVSLEFDGDLRINGISLG